MVFGFDYYLESALDTAARSSRTAKGGKVDTTFSGAKGKPQGIISDPEEMKRVVFQNIRECVGILYDQREADYTPGSFKTLVEVIAERASRGTIAPRPTVYRTHEIDLGKGYGCPVAEIPKFMDMFSLFGSVVYNVRIPNEHGLVVLQAILEKTLDKDIHPFADACGRTAKLITLGLAMRNGMSMRVSPEIQKRYDTMGPVSRDINMFSPESARGLVQYLSQQEIFVKK